MHGGEGSGRAWLEGGGGNSQDLDEIQCYFILYLHLLALPEAALNFCAREGAGRPSTGCSSRLTTVPFRHALQPRGCP